MQLTAAERYLLQPYKEVLPAREYLILELWLSQFWPFQRPWILEQARRAFCNKSRQIGISHSTAGLLVLWGAFLGETTTVISIGQLESNEVLDKCKKHREVLTELGSVMARRPRGGRGKNNETEISFSSGGRIIALPSTGGRSFTGNVYLDEFAYYERPKAVWDAAMAVTMLGFRSRISSTPNGTGNDFHEICTNPVVNHGWQGHEIPIARAIVDGYPVDLADCMTLAKGDQRIFDQLFNCSFLDNQLQYLPSDLIDGCVVEDLTCLEGQYYAGLDIGRENDFTVLTVVRYLKGVRWLAYVEYMKRTDSDGLEAMVAKAFDRFKLRRLCLDATGLDTFPADRIKKKHSEKVDIPNRRPRVEPIEFTPNSKEDLATGLHAALQGKTLRLPRKDDNRKVYPESPWFPPGTAERFVKDLSSIRRIVTPSGNVTYDAPRTAQGHADYAWSLALALHASSSVNPMLDALRKRQSAA